MSFTLPIRSVLLTELLAEREVVGEQNPRILLADDHPMMLAGLRNVLDPLFDVVGTATDGRALLELAEIRRPDLVIADISMPGLNGIEVTRRLRGLLPKTRVLILSIHTDPEWAKAAFDAGAYGYLTKDSAPKEVETAVREVLKGRFYLSPVVTQAFMGLAKEDSVERQQYFPGSPGTPRPATGDALTPRETDTLRLLGRGLGNKEIAHELGVSVTTVRTHLNRIYEKMGPMSRVELALHAANPLSL
jgi:DNA-binding NarL/FixJ family response regulator